MITKNKQKLSDIHTEPIYQDDFKHYIYPIGKQISSLEEKVKSLESRIDYEMKTREKIIETTESATQWKINTLVAIVLGVLALIFK
jgi:hypothetical protein